MAAWFALTAPWLEIVVGAYWLLAGLISAAVFSALGPDSERMPSARVESVMTKRILHLLFGGAILPLVLAFAVAVYLAGVLLPGVSRRLLMRVASPATKKE